MVLHSANAQILAHAWRFLPEFARWLILWTVNPKVIVGVSGVALNDHNEVLLLKHRFHPDTPWGLPGGWVHRNETIVEGWQREVREETNLQVQAQTVVLQTNRRVTQEFILAGRIVAGELKLDTREILAADYYRRDTLPELLADEHRIAIERVFQNESVLTLPSTVGRQ